MQKYANLVELEKCCQTHIFLQNFVLIQPRTSPPKICKILQKIAKFANFANPPPLTLPRLNPTSAAAAAAFRAARSSFAVAAAATRAASDAAITSGENR